jgi:hypothetical protein
VIAGFFEATNDLERAFLILTGATNEERFFRSRLGSERSEAVVLQGPEFFDDCRVRPPPAESARLTSGRIG